MRVKEAVPSVVGERVRVVLLELVHVDVDVELVGEACVEQVAVRVDVAELLQSGGPLEGVSSLI